MLPRNPLLDSGVPYLFIVIVRSIAYQWGVSNIRPADLILQVKSGPLDEFRKIKTTLKRCVL